MVIDFRKVLLIGEEVLFIGGSTLEKVTVIC